MRWPIQKKIWLNYYSNFQNNVFREVGVWWLGCPNLAPCTCGNLQAATVGSNLCLPTVQPFSPLAAHEWPTLAKLAFSSLFQKQPTLLSDALVSQNIISRLSLLTPSLLWVSHMHQHPIKRATTQRCHQTACCSDNTGWVWQAHSMEAPNLSGVPKTPQSPPGENIPHLWTHALIHIHMNCLKPFAFALYLPQQSPKQDRKPFLITLAFVPNHLLRSYSVKHCARCEGCRDERTGRPKCWWVLTAVIRPS